MQQRTAVLLAMGMAACAAAAVILLSARLAENQRADRHGYQQAMAQQRREAGRALPMAVPAAPRAAAEVCVRGVDGFAQSLRTALPAAGMPDVLPDVLDDTGRLDVVTFAALSDLALRAERWVEQARGLPALPQRMGRVRTAGEPGAAAGEVVWQPLQPARVVCGGGEAYAAVPLDVEPAPARPVPGDSAGVRLGE
jgi:hypothetical protein